MSINKLGEGGNGLVSLEEDKKTAKKSLHKKHIENSERTRRFKREYDILSFLNGLTGSEAYRFCKVFPNSWIQTEDEISFRLLYINGDAVTLDSIVGGFNGKDKNPLKEEVALTYFRDLLTTVNYCHQYGVLHRDIKPNNILLSVIQKKMYI